MNDYLTTSLLIGNSDNRLTQEDWSSFIYEIKHAVQFHCNDIYFSGGSNYDETFQNACWVFEINVFKLESLKKEVKDIRQMYKQDSVALVIGHTNFI